MADAERFDRAALRRWIGPRTQEQAAKVLGCAQSTLSQFLSGERELSFARIKHWSKVSGIAEETFVLARLKGGNRAA